MREEAETMGEGREAERERKESGGGDNGRGEREGGERGIERQWERVERHREEAESGRW